MQNAFHDPQRKNKRLLAPPTLNHARDEQERKTLSEHACGGASRSVLRLPWFCLKISGLPHRGASINIRQYLAWL